ncbi:MAG: hypothetical protein IJX62_07550, partial [Clostridia bacterium]|nr:hypothetical protein [Clostridia bacterium]
MKRKILSLVLAMTMILSAFAGVITVTAQEPEAQPVIQLLDGAAIRCADPSGIRFISKLEGTYSPDQTPMGTFIFPYNSYKTWKAEQT